MINVKMSLLLYLCFSVNLVFCQVSKDLYSYSREFDHSKDSYLYEDPYKENPINNQDIIAHLESLNSLYLEEGYALTVDFSKERLDTLFFNVVYTLNYDSLNADFKLVHYRDSVYFDLYRVTRNTKGESSEKLSSQFYSDELFQIETSLDVIIPVSVKKQLKAKLKGIDSLVLFRVEYTNPRNVFNHGQDYMEYDRTVIKEKTIKDQNKLLKVESAFFKYVRIGNELSEDDCLCDEDLEQYTAKVYNSKGQVQISIFLEEEYISIVKDKDNLMYFFYYPKGELKHIVLGLN